VREVKHEQNVAFANLTPEETASVKEEKGATRASGKGSRCLLIKYILFCMKTSNPLCLYCYNPYSLQNNVPFLFSYI
jgi:hypothetical protein